MYGPQYGTYLYLQVLVDQVVMVPVAVSLFLIIVGKLEGQSSQNIVHDIRQKG